jgi:hypothetical protein
VGLCRYFDHSARVCGAGALEDIQGSGRPQGIAVRAARPERLGEPKASLSRFQFLIFTFVIAGLYLLLCIEAGTLIEIPGNVLALLGISGGTYVVSKTVSASENKTPPAAAPKARRATTAE